MEVKTFWKEDFNSCVTRPAGSSGEVWADRSQLKVSKDF